MRPGVNLMYLEGEVKGGRLTGRTILVIETDRKLDSDGSAPSDLKQLVSAACVEWEKICCPADLVRVEYHASGENEASNGSTTSYRSIGFLAGR